MVTVTARDDFPKRSQDRFGVAEYIELVAIATSVTTAPDLRWFIASDTSGGALSGTAGNDGTGLYTAGDTAGEVTLVVKVVSGPQAGAIVARKTITIVAPTDAVMVQAPNTYIYHQHGTYTVGFLGDIFLRPKDVSFENIHFQEGTCKAESTGYLTRLHPQCHPLGNVCHVSGGDAENGSQVYGTDTVWAGPLFRPYADGDFKWAIPWRYGAPIPSPGMPTTTRFTTAIEHATSDATGRAMIEKKGAGPFFADANDPTSGYHDPTG
jgi:hypothetical protein